MNEDTCCICLTELKNNTKESCGHKLHFQCFMKLTMLFTLFIECPLVVG